MSSKEALYGGNKLPLDVDDAVCTPKDNYYLADLYEKSVTQIAVEFENGLQIGPKVANVFQPRKEDENGMKHYVHIGPLEVVITVPPADATDKAKIEAYIDPPLFRPSYIGEAKGSLSDGLTVQGQGYFLDGNVTAKCEAGEPLLVLEYHFVALKEAYKGKFTIFI